MWDMRLLHLSSVHLSFLCLLLILLSLRALAGRYLLHRKRLLLSALRSKLQQRSSLNSGGDVTRFGGRTGEQGACPLRSRWVAVFFLSITILISAAAISTHRNSDGCSCFGQVCTCENVYVQADYVGRDPFAYTLRTNVSFFAPFCRPQLTKAQEKVQDYLVSRGGDYFGEPLFSKGQTLTELRFRKLGACFSLENMHPAYLIERRADGTPVVR
jgi:hypothetical protein